MRTRTRIGFAVAVVSVVLAASAGGAAPLFLDATTLRAEVASRRAVYGTTPAGPWAVQARRLDRVLRILDTSSGSIGEDLVALEASARLLQSTLGDDPAIRGRLQAVLDEGEAVVAGTRDQAQTALEATADGPPARRASAELLSADRRIEASLLAPNPGRRAHCLRRAFRRIEAARTDLGIAPAGASVSAAVATPSVFPGTPQPFAANGGCALVAVDVNGAPTALVLRFRRAPPGGPATATLEIRVDSGFTGAGTWPLPTGSFDLNGLGTLYRWFFTASSPATNTLVVTEFDPAAGRIAGTFALRATGNQYGQSVDMTGGSFEVSGALFRRE